MDTYRIGVSIALRNGVSAGLRLIRHDLGGLMKAMDKAGDSSVSLGKKLLTIGSAMTVAGAATLDVYEKIVTAGAKIVSQQAAMRAVGIGPQNVAANTRASWAASTTLSNVTPQQAMEMMQRLRAMTGNSAEARQLLVPVLKSDVAMNAMLGGHHGTGLIQALKAVDISGGLIKNGKIDPGKLMTVLPTIEQTMLLTHGMISGNQILRMMQQAGPAATAISFNKLLKDSTEAVMALGPAVGRGLFTSYMVANVGRASAVSAKFLTSLGMVPQKDMHKVKGSSTYLFNPKNMYAADYLRKHGFLDWIHSKVIPHLQAKGDNSPQKLMRDLTGIFPASTSARLLSWVVHNWPQAQRFRSLIDKGIKSGHPYTSVSQLNWSVAVQSFQKAWSGLMTALGAPQVKSAVGTLNAITGAIHHLTMWLSKNPAKARLIGQSLLGLGAGLVTLGVIIASAGVVALLGPMGALAAIGAGIAAMATVIISFHWKSVLGTVVGGMKAIGNAIEWLIHPITHFIHAVLGKTHTVPGAVGLANLRNPFMGPDGRIEMPGAPPSARPASGDHTHAVHVTNAHEIGKAIKSGLAAHMNANQSGTTGWNGRVSPFGSPAFVGP